MKLNETKSPSPLSPLGSKINLFFILAFAPLLLIFYYSPFSIVIPFYGFLLLFLKYRRLLGVDGTNSFQKIFGSIVVIGSFFVYYGVVLIYPGAAPYTVANYAVYLFGLFFAFFNFSALKEAFTPLFLIVAATSSSFMAAGLKPFLSPFANDFAHIIVSILRLMGINADIHSRFNMSIINFPSLSGEMVSGAFVYECLGVYSVLVFSILLVVILFEAPNGLKVKTTFATAGLLGTFAVNVLRVIIIFLVDYFYGAEVGGTVHYVIGYALFSAWLTFFFYLYSKRQTFHITMASLTKRISRRRVIVSS